MATDPIRFPLLTVHDLKILSRGPEVLLSISQIGSGTVYFPTELGDATLSGITSEALDQWRQAAIECGAIVVDGRSCDCDTYIDLIISGPMPAVGPGKSRLIDGTRNALSYVAAEDYACSLEAIGAVVHNLPPIRKAA